MCWNKTVSATALGVGFGSVMLGILWIDDPYFTCISIIFLFLLVMQLAELLAYIAKERKNNIDKLHINRYLMRYATQLALLGNIGQPLIATLALLPLSRAGVEMKLAAFAFMVAYGVWFGVMASTRMSSYSVISKNFNMNPDPRAEPCRSTYNPYYYGKKLEYTISKYIEYFFGDKQEDCHSHVIYPWWREVSPIMYLVTLGAVIILLIRPLSYMIYTFIAIFGVLILSIFFFNDGEVGSQWCLGVVSLCILNPFFYYFLVKRPGKGYKWEC